MVIVLTVVNNTNNHRKIIKIGINFIIPIVILIFVLTSFMNLSLFSAELGIDATRYSTASYNSIGITVLIVVLYYVGKVFPKVSLKRKVTIFIISLLILTDVVIWANLSLIEIVMEGIGSISVDLTPLFMGFVIVLILNLFIKGCGLFNIIKEDKIKEKKRVT